MRPIRNNKAFVLIWLIMSISLAMIMGSALFVGSFLNSQINLNYHNVKSAYYTAQAGVEYARIIICNSPPYKPFDSTSWPSGASTFDPFGNGAIVNVVIAQEGTGTGYTITSTGTSNGQSKTLTVTTYSTGAVKSWK